VSRLWAGQSMVHILDVSRPVLGPIQACYLVGSRAFLQVYSELVVKLTTHLHLMPKLMSPTNYWDIKSSQVLNEDRCYKY